MCVCVLDGDACVGGWVGSVWVCVWGSGWVGVWLSCGWMTCVWWGDAWVGRWCVGDVCLGEWVAVCLG